MAREVKLKLQYIILVILFVGSIYMLRKYTTPEYQFVNLLFSVNFVYLLIKILIGLTYSPSKLPVKYYTVSVIMPSFNESKDSVVTAIKTLLKQSYPIHEIIFVDDGSDSDEAYQAIKNIDISQLHGINEINRNTELISIRLEKNQGKKKAQEIGFQRATGELFFLVDSDGEITETALEEMIRPLSNPYVGSVVGRIEVRNLNQSYWTRVQDIFYSNSFQVGRAAQSQTGTVIVCSGALSIHRARIVKRSLSTFKREKFLGVPCSAGDDRILTDMSLERRYSTVYQSTAICYTDVPVTLRQLFKQQVRWTKSAYLISLFSLRYFFIRPVALTWSITETYLWLYNILVTLGLLFRGELSVGFQILAIAIIYFILVSYLTNIYYSSKSLLTYALSFYYSVGYSVVLLSVRLYALFTLFKTGWATR